jgi:hypothetical protein
MSALKRALVGLLLAAGVVASLFLAHEAWARGGRGGIGRPGVGPGGVGRHPVPVAGVARRTTRRVVRRSAIYVTALPYGCTTVTIDYASYYQCGYPYTYYVTSGTRYEVVYVDGGSSSGSSGGSDDEDNDDEGDDDC